MRGASPPLTLKPLEPSAVPRALERAERYRLLNEPIEAESICLDILAVSPSHQGALVTLLLALTDQFESGAKNQNEPRELLARLSSEYERHYYAGIISERYAKSELGRDRPGVRFSAYDSLREAMASYEKAEDLAPDGNDDAVLRYNACVRMIERDRLVAGKHYEHDLPLE